MRANENRFAKLASRLSGHPTLLCGGALDPASGTSVFSDASAGNLRRLDRLRQAIINPRAPAPRIRAVRRRREPSARRKNGPPRGDFLAHGSMTAHGHYISLSFLT